MSTNNTMINRSIKTATEFIKLRESQNEQDCYDAARVVAPDYIWLEVIEKHPYMREWVAHNKTVKGDILKLLSKDPDPVVRRQVADRRAASEEILCALAHDHDDCVKLGVIRNRKVTEKVLKILLDDKDEYVRKEAYDRLIKLQKNI